MSAIWLVIIGILLTGCGYLFYGGYLSKQLKLRDDQPTPAHTLNDGVDYVPARRSVLFGHHFASIAGASPIIGPILAAVFGWLPVFLWLVFGAIFIGIVHDMGSIVASIRHQGRSIGEVAEERIGHTGKVLFLIFIWIFLVLTLGAFIDIVASTFATTPATATASSLFIVLAVVFGFGVYRKGFHLGISSLIGVALLFLCIYIGIKFPLQLSHSTWSWILIAYIFVAGVTPVWILLQPRDYLNSFLLFILILGAFAGIIVSNPHIELEAYRGFTQIIGGKTAFLFPILFVTVACGAISGFHSLVGSGTTAKQLEKESHAQTMGAGGILLECLLGVTAIITAAVISIKVYSGFIEGGGGGPIVLFAEGVGGFLTKLGISYSAGATFVALAVSAFALTTLDTAGRLARYCIQEYFSQWKDTPVRIFHTNRYVGTFISAAAGGGLALSGSYLWIWPVFGSANQLLAALALLVIAAWLATIKIKNKNFVYPMVFMFLVTLSALGVIFYQSIKEFNPIYLAFAIILFILAIWMIVLSIKKLSKFRMEQ